MSKKPQMRALVVVLAVTALFNSVSKLFEELPKFIDGLRRVWPIIWRCLEIVVSPSPEFVLFLHRFHVLAAGAAACWLYASTRAKTAHSRFLLAYFVTCALYYMTLLGFGVSGLPHGGQPLVVRTSIACCYLGMTVLLTRAAISVLPEAKNELRRWSEQVLRAVAACALGLLALVFLAVLSSSKHELAFVEVVERGASLLGALGATTALFAFWSRVSVGGRILLIAYAASLWGRHHITQGFAPGLVATYYLSMLSKFGLLTATLPRKLRPLTRHTFKARPRTSGGPLHCRPSPLEAEKVAGIRAL